MEVLSKYARSEFYDNNVQQCRDAYNTCLETNNPESNACGYVESDACEGMQFGDGEMPAPLPPSKISVETEGEPVALCFIFDVNT